jgi:hypothetical protein
MIIGRDEELRKRISKLIVEIYEKEPDKSRFASPWRAEMAWWMDGCDVVTTDEGVDFAFVGWAEYKTHIFSQGGMLPEYRNFKYTQKFIKAGARYMSIIRKFNKTNKPIWGYVSPTNTEIHKINEVLGIKNCFEMPEGL